MDPTPAAYRVLEDGDEPSCLLDAALRITHVNAGWTRFAAANNGAEVLRRWGPGACVLDAISTELRGFYRTLFETVRASGQRLEHDYECSSPQRFRTYRMLVYPSKGATLVVTHALRVERAHDRPALPADDARYRHEGLLRMCSHCRRVRGPTPEERWDWLPDYVNQMPPDVSHGLCPPCFEHYYPE